LAEQAEPPATSVEPSWHLRQMALLHTLQLLVQVAVQVFGMVES
jgi:hypothetical protein